MKALIVRAIVGALVGAAIVAATVAHSERAKRQSGRTQPDANVSAKAKSRQDVPLPGRRLDALKLEPVKPKNAESGSKATAKDVAKDATGHESESAAVAAPTVPDEWSPEEVVSALRDCIRLLGPIAADVDVTVPIRKAACGTAAPVRLNRIGRENPVVLSPPATMNCPMVVALHKWIESQVQPEAKRTLGSFVVSLENVSAYNCRHRNGSKSTKLSEHAFANAIDIGRFKMADGQIVSVLNDWGPTARDLQPASTVAPEVPARTSPVAARPLPATQKAEAKDASAGADNIPLPERRSDLAKVQTPKKGSAEEKSKQVKDAGKAAGGKAKSASPAVEKGATGATRTEPVSAGGATSKKAVFLKKVHERACGLFGTVLGPEADRKSVV